MELTLDRRKATREIPVAPHSSSRCLVGPGAELADELLRTHVARNVAEAYPDGLRPVGEAI